MERRRTTRYHVGYRRSYHRGRGSRNRNPFGGRNFIIVESSNNVENSTRDGKFKNNGNLKNDGKFNDYQSQVIHTRYGLAANGQAQSLEQMWRRMQTLLTAKEQKLVIQITQVHNCRGPAGRIQEGLGIIQENFYKLLSDAIIQSKSSADQAQAVMDKLHQETKEEKQKREKAAEKKREKNRRNRERKKEKKKLAKMQKEVPEKERMEENDTPPLSPKQPKPAQELNKDGQEGKEIEPEGKKIEEKEKKQTQDNDKKDKITIRRGGDTNQQQEQKSMHEVYKQQDQRQMQQPDEMSRIIWTHTGRMVKQYSGVLNKEKRAETYSNYAAARLHNRNFYGDPNFSPPKPVTMNATIAKPKQYQQNQMNRQYPQDNMTNNQFPQTITHFQF